MGNNFSVLQMVLKIDVQREGDKKFISCCEEDIENLENGEKDGSEQGVESLKGGDFANVLQPQMETTKEKNPKEDGKGWQSEQGVESLKGGDFANVFFSFVVSI